MTMSKSDLGELIADLHHQGGDTTACEVKRGRGGVPQIGETLSAFGNMPEGGTIVVGLDEASGFTATGISDVAAVKQGIANQARVAVTPPVSVDFEDFAVDGNDVLVCHVSGLPLPARPCLYQGRPYLRHADGDYPMSDVEIQMIEDRKRQAALDDSSLWVRDDMREVPDSGVDDLNDTLVEALLRNARNRSVFHRAKTDEVVLRNLGVVAKSGRLTVAGAYVLGEYPQQFVPSWSATAAVQLQSGVGARTRDLVHFEGPVPELLAEINAWVSRNLHTTIGYRSDGNAFDEAELPAVAVRELVANALVHRDLSPLSYGKRVEIRLSGDRLVIANPGGLRGITTAQLGHRGGKHAVNETVYSLCEKLTLPDGSRVIEAEGGGIREARERMRAAGLKPIKFYDTGVSFVAVVSRRRLLSEADLEWLSTAAAGHRLSQEQRIILASMHHGEAWTNKLVRKEFDQIDSREATSLLQDLVSRNLAVVTGSRGGARYRLADRFPLSSDDVLHVESRPPSTALSEPAVPRPSVSNEELIRNALDSSGGQATIADLADRTGLTERQLRYALHSMGTRGAVVDLGGRPKRWTLAPRSD
ncbi:putative DNA binding domain-containing protein [Gordonia sp. X0973]|uniref:DNA glycosylase AlkZ-like family protein n=1 Tax=Gordonia sp. X0973 TaxID=2742602 RepID=UPI000F529F4F|nr:crosslink repair DNA glycosylase YcaQ family protein [Gordonia sp. X0973]QKT08698.1 putative DNA binding domain-containing protein [Gordonia sp. X0973]